MPGAEAHPASREASLATWGPLRAASPPTPNRSAREGGSFARDTGQGSACPACRRGGRLAAPLEREPGPFPPRDPGRVTVGPRLHKPGLPPRRGAGAGATPWGGVVPQISGHHTTCCRRLARPEARSLGGSVRSFPEPAWTDLPGWRLRRAGTLLAKRGGGGVRRLLTTDSGSPGHDAGGECRVRAVTPPGRPATVRRLSFPGGRALRLHEATPTTHAHVISLTAEGLK